jgi:membrane associated rhomboid family serine protease
VSSPLGGTFPQTEVTYCYRHPNREASVRCIRCDRPICPECMRPASVGFQCPDDVRTGARSIRAQRTAVGARLRQSPPYVTVALIVLNVAAYLGTGLQHGASLSDPTGSTLFRDWNLLPFDVHDRGRYWELITSAFLHVGFLHIASNMIALIVIGPVLELMLGRWRFTAAYLLSALGGSAAVYCFGSPFNPVVGASGAIFGLFGAALVLVRRLGLDVQWLAAIIVLNFVLTFSISGISKLGHIGGFVTGVLTAVAIGGLPRNRQRVPTERQILGLAALGVLIVVLVIARSASPLQPAWFG